MNKAINSIAIKYKYMKDILQERFFQLLLECSQRKVSVTEFTEAIEELATHLADFSFGLHRLKSYRVRFEQEKNALFAFD